MTEIAKHHAKEEGESHTGVIGRVYLFITRGAIRVDYLLERVGELVDLEVGWRYQAFISDLLQLNQTRAAIVDAF